MVCMDGWDGDCLGVWLLDGLLQGSCADPESFVRGSPTLTFFVFLVDGIERGPKCHKKWTIIGLPAKCH